MKTLVLVMAGVIAGLLAPWIAANRGRRGNA
jgi:hypothetical protein